MLDLRMNVHEFEPSVCEALVRIQSNGTEIIMSQDNTIGFNLGLT